MSKIQRKWLRITVIIGIGAATFTTLAIVTIYGAIAPTNYIGAVSSAANCTTWSAVTLFSGTTPIIELLIPVSLIAIAIMIIFLVGLLRVAYMGGMAE